MSFSFPSAVRGGLFPVAAMVAMAAGSAAAFDEPLTDELKAEIRKGYIDVVVAELLEPLPHLEAQPEARCFQWNDIHVLVATPAPGSGDVIRERLNAFPELDYESMTWDLDGRPRFRFFSSPGNRWSSTANGSVSLRQPFTLTFSYAPDGTTIPNGVGEGSGASTLFATMNPAFGGGQAQWQQLFVDTFQLWATWTVITYTNVNDDGVMLFNNAGVGTTRGDVRIGMKNIDGSGGEFDVLAYNFSPDNGDMVMDSSNVSFFSNGSAGYRRFKNVVAHEHGHGLGFAHVGPINTTKLMEATVAVNYTGPQYDDQRAVMYNYGDRYEANNSAATARHLGTLGDGQTITEFQTVAIETSSAVDFYSVDLPANSQLTVLLAPRLGSYQEGPQSGPTSSLNAGTIQNLQFSIVGTDGSTILTAVNETSAGLNETVTDFPLNTAGRYYLRVSSAGGSDAPQVYTIQLTNTLGTPMSAQNWNLLE